jgi:hypothetical protein
MAAAVGELPPTCNLFSLKEAHGGIVLNDDALFRQQADSFREIHIRAVFD